MNPLHPQHGPALSRRRFVRGLAAGGVLAAMPNWLYARSLQASANGTTHGSAPEIRGTSIDLVVEETLVNFTGSVRKATAINGSIPAPTLRLREGDEVTIRVTNRMSVPTSIHWHGILLPYQMDGVPGLSYRGIAPGDTFTYRFTLRQSGTFWYHSHTGMQEMTGMYGALIIEPRHAAVSPAADRDYVVQLSDWSDDDPMDILRYLKTHSDLYNFNQPTVAGFHQDASADGLAAAWQKRLMWNEMRMSPTDLSDTSAAVLTFLLNGTTPAGNWTGLFQRGETVKLRLINSAATTFFDVRIPGQHLTVVSADGQPVQPVSVDEFRFGPGETYDVLVTPTADACTLFAQTIDRSGYACGTLATAAGMSAPVPQPDPVEWLTMQDMMGNMNHADMAGMSGMDHAAMNMGNTDQSAMAGMSGMSGMDHSTMNMGSTDQSAMTGMNGMDHSGMNMGSTDHSGMAMGGMSMGAIDHSSMDHSSMNHDMGAMDHSGMTMNSMPGSNPLNKASQTVRHARTEYGASVDMRVDTPRTNLDDPGVGLRQLQQRQLRPAGHKVLTLADLRSVAGVFDDNRTPVKEIELHLTGNMERYSWSLDGLEFGDSTPVAMKHNERIRVILHNDTMMTHPMHLHGMWSDLESPDGGLLVRRHTIPVQPAQRISFLTTPHDLGRWAWHCHLMFHMDMGMFREVVVYE